MFSTSKKVSDYLRSEIKAGSFPGAQYAIGEQGRIIFEGSVGWASIEPDRSRATSRTIYDVASLTKPLVTSLLAVIFSERGLLDLNAPLGTYLAEFDSDSKPPITPVHLLTHTTGLPAWIPLYTKARSREEATEAIAHVFFDSASSPVTAQTVYSDINFILLGFMLERIGGKRIDALAEENIFRPLGLRQTMFNPPDALKRQCAATERGREYERATIEREMRWGAGAQGRFEQGGRGAEEQGRINTQTPTSPSPHHLLTSSPQHPSTPAPQHPHSPAPPRPRSPAPLHLFTSSPLQGEVHDGNARFLDGAAGHAGLFSTAREVFRIAQEFLEGSRLVASKSLHLFSSNFTQGRGDARSLGWMLASTTNCSAGPRLSPSAFGHTGFTGTSVWIEPASQRVFVLLTNRVHPTVMAVDMKEVRRGFNTLAFDALDRK
jgi:CubicO group peptidase (beta-lactamase class C family)